jgi:hypothetical protein
MRQALGANVMKFSALSLLENRLERLSIYIFQTSHGNTSANRAKPGPSFQL